LGENLFDFLLMAQSSQRVEPPQNPGRFSHAVSPPWRRTPGANEDYR
jgi:hypothetical protein